MNLFPISSTYASGLALLDAPLTRSFAVTGAESSGATSLDALAAAKPGEARRVTSSLPPAPSLNIDSLSGLVAEANLRALVLQQFGSSASTAAASTKPDLDLHAFVLEQLTAGLSTTTSNSQSPLNSASSSLAQALTDSSPSSTSLFGVVDDAFASWRTEPADTNGDGLVSMNEEFAYTRTHSLFGAL